MRIEPAFTLPHPVPANLSEIRQNPTNRILSMIFVIYGITASL